MEQKLIQKQFQKLLFTQTMQESMQILQMPLLELKMLVEKEMQDNPLLEEDIQQNEQSTGVSGNIDEDSQPKELWVTKPLSLHEHLLQQLRMSSASSEDIVIGEEIIGNIDDDGYLKASAEEISQSLNADVQKVNSMIQFIQGFEPAGIGARDLKECLLIQLGIKGKKDTVCWKIAENYLELCGKKQYAQIAKLLGVPLDTVKAGIVEIGKLEPKPGKLYSVEPNPHYVIPDIYIKKIDNEYYVAGNAFDIPVLKVNTSYEAILKDKNSDKQTRDYIREKMRAANFLIKCIRERQKTIHKIVENLVKEQDEFIEKGRSYLKPLTLKKVAQAIGRHQSTISRAIENKYVETPAGIYAMKEFFSAGIPSANGHSDETQENTEHSATSVKMEIKNIIDTEEKAKPLSDQKLQKILGEKGINISRRTIAKYREELKILPSHLRKT